MFACRSANYCERIAQLAQNVGRSNVANTVLYRRVCSAGVAALYGGSTEQVHV